MYLVLRNQRQRGHVNLGEELQILTTLQLYPYISLSGLRLLQGPQNLRPGTSRTMVDVLGGFSCCSHR
jgi:hypothetical protein